LTVKEITNDVGISTGSFHSILTGELGTKRVSARLIPILLTEGPNEYRIEMCLELKNSGFIQYV